MNIVRRSLIHVALVSCFCTLSACGGSNNAEPNDQNGQLADPLTNEPPTETQDPDVTPSEPTPSDPTQTDPTPTTPIPSEPTPSDPAPTPTEPDSVPAPVSSVPPHLRAANITLRTSLSEDLQALLPEDCLLEVGGAIYCYSVSTRTLMAVLKNPVSIYWQFPLPGDESSNRIEALKILDTYTLGIIANTTTETANPRYELSRFNLDGAFCCTFNIFESLASLKGSSDAPYPAINIDRGYITTASEADQLAIAGTYSSLIPNGNRSDLNDWVANGSLLTAISTDNGKRKATRLFKGETIVDINYASRSTLEVTSDVASYRLDAETLADKENVPSQSDGAAISEESIAVLLPGLYHHLQGNALENLGVEAESVGATFDNTLDADLPDCARSEDTSTCYYDIDAAATTFACQYGGDVTITSSESREFIPGIGRNLQTSITLDFNDCLAFVANRNLFSTSAVGFNGIVTISTFDGGVRQGNSDSKTYRFDDYRVRYQDKNLEQRQEWLTGSLTVADVATSQLDRQRKLNVIHYELAEIVYPRNQPGPLVSPLLSVSNMTYSRSTVFSDGVNLTSVVVDGSLDAVGDITNEQRVSMLIDPVLFRPYISSTTGLSGGISLTADDGSSVVISARNTPSDLSEELELTFDTGVSRVMPFESLVRPWINR